MPASIKNIVKSYINKPAPNAEEFQKLQHLVGLESTDSNEYDMVGYEKFSRLKKAIDNYQHEEGRSRIVGVQVGILDIAILNSWPGKQKISLINTKKFTKDTLTRALSYYLFTHTFPEVRPIDPNIIEAFIVNGAELKSIQRFGYNHDFPCVSELLYATIAADSEPNLYKPTINELIRKRQMGYKDVERLYQYCCDYKRLDSEFTTFLDTHIKTLKEEHRSLKNPKDFLAIIQNQTHSTIAEFGRDPEYKERVIKHIEQLPNDEKRKVIQNALQKGSALYNFFDTQRGFFACNQTSGSFKKLKKIEAEMQKEKTEMQLVSKKQATNELYRSEAVEGTVVEGTETSIGYKNK